MKKREREIERKREAERERMQEVGKVQREIILVRRSYTCCTQQ